MKVQRLLLLLLLLLLVRYLGIYVNESNEPLLANLFASPDDSRITLSFFINYVCWFSKYGNEDKVLLLSHFCPYRLDF